MDPMHIEVEKLKAEIDALRIKLMALVKKVEEVKHSSVLDEFTRAGL